jgi:hypothetical protein
MYPYRLPLRFIGLWILNLAILLALGIGLGIQDYLVNTLHIPITRGLTYIYLGLGFLLAGLEDLLIDKLKGNT